MLALAILAMAAAVPLACLCAERLGEAGPGHGSVVLVEHLRQSRGQLVNGTYPAPSLDGSDYAFDALQRQLSAVGFVVNDSLRVVLGVVDSLAQDAGTGRAGTAYGIYSIPSGADGIALESLAPDGTVTLTYNGTRIVLAPGERWETVATEAVVTPGYTIRLTRSDAIKNSGFVAKSSIN